jgi:threonine dehydratase
LLQTQAVIIVPDYMPAGEIHELKELGCVVLQRPACGPITPLASACQQQAFYINPLNDCHVLAGMGTVGLEILQQIKDSGGRLLQCESWGRTGGYWNSY